MSDTKNSINWLSILSTIFMYLLVAWAGYMVGEIRGMERQREIQKQVECQSDYGYKPISEVPVRCYQYFDIKK